MSLTKIGSIGINTGIQFAGVTTVSTLHVGSGVTLSSDGDGFFTGIITATFAGDGTSLTGVASTDNIRTNTNATFLQNINVSGTVTATSYAGSGANLTNLPAANLTGALPAISGANLTNLDASDLASGTVPTARLGSGTASSSTFLRGDSTFAAVTSTTINSNADNRIITGSGTANTLNGESTLTYDGTNLDLNADNKKLRLGTGNDMLLYHDGTKSRIHSASHDISIRSGGVFGVYNGDGTEEMILATPDGAVELYHNNVKKLNTNANGLAVHGGTHFNSSAVTGTPLTYLYGYAGTDAKGVTIENIEAGLELISNANGNHSSSILLRNLNDGFAIINDNDANSLQIRYFTAVSNDFNAHGNGNGLSKLETSAVFNEDGAVQLYNNNVKTFETSSNGATILAGEGGSAYLYMSSDEGDDNGDKWQLKIDNGDQAFMIKNYASGSWETSIEANGNGNVELYFDNSKKLETTTNGIKVNNRIEVIANAIVDNASAGNNCGILFGSAAVLPAAGSGSLSDNAIDLGSSSTRWRNLYTTDLQLSNEGKTNDVDGTWGNYTIQEGESDLFLINNRSGKKYKFNLTEVS